VIPISAATVGQEMPARYVDAADKGNDTVLGAGAAELAELHSVQCAS